MFRAITDTVDASLCVIDNKGHIVFTNNSWRRFGRANGATPDSLQKPGNYLQICDLASREQCESAKETAISLRALLNGEIARLSLEYPCHSPDKQRWFSLVGRRLRWQGPALFLLEHHDITERKLAELDVQRLSLTDALTQLANRRHFDQFLDQAWAQHRRDGKALALIMLDIDHFKRLNDRYGHAAGDACLVRVADTLRQHARRAGDLAARYGGEEFALILQDTTAHRAEQIAEQLRKDISDLQIRNEDADTGPVLTASFGVCGQVPSGKHSTVDLIKDADQALYQAKASGRNRVVMADRSSYRTLTSRPAPEPAPVRHIDKRRPAG